MHHLNHHPKQHFVIIIIIIIIIVIIIAIIIIIIVTAIAIATIIAMGTNDVPIRSCSRHRFRPTKRGACLKPTRHGGR